MHYEGGKRAERTVVFVGGITVAPAPNADAMRQWERDHPDGVISDEELETMDRYAAESCREERQQ